MQRLNLEGEPADPANAPSGCVFHPRCNYMEDVCTTDVPELTELRPGHHVACHFADQLELRGIAYSDSKQS
jgi:peptide/nickel transport system ATP-binding protein